ncbi:Hypothetical predicted protein, partial [Pelobates cultripes]
VAPLSLPSSFFPPPLLSSSLLLFPLLHTELLLLPFSLCLFFLFSSSSSGPWM